jgi:hypothetical protein
MIVNIKKKGKNKIKYFLHNKEKKRRYNKKKRKKVKNF